MLNGLEVDNVEFPEMHGYEQALQFSVVFDVHWVGIWVYFISISERFEASEASPSKKFSILFKGFDASENTLVLTAVYSASASIIHLLAQIVERSTH